MIKEQKLTPVLLCAPEIYEINVLAVLMSVLADTKEVSTHADRNAKKCKIKMPSKKVGIQIPVEKACKMFDILRKMGFLTMSEAGLEDVEKSDDPDFFKKEVEEYQGFSMDENGEIVYNDIETAVINGAYLDELSTELRYGLNEEAFEKASSAYRPEPEAAMQIAETEDAE